MLAKEKKINIFCFGFGQVAKSFINKVISENFKIYLSTTTTGKTCQKTFNGITYQNYFFKDDSYDNDLILKLREADCILVSIPPVNESDSVIKFFSSVLEVSKSKWITYLSATSVYGNHK